MKILVILIVFLAFFLRTFRLSDFPSGFTPDEASFGYDAYSLLKTGKDQWGHSFPLVLESFGDFKSPLYAYLTIPFIFIFGFKKWVVRFPNVVLGTASVYIIYLLVYQILVRDGKEKNTNFYVRGTAILSSFLLAISPWHVMMSRGAFEANLTTIFLPLSLYFFLKGLRNTKYFTLGSIFAGINIFSYHSAKLVTPLVFIFTIVVFRKELVKNFGIYHLISGFIVLVFAGMFFLSLHSGSLIRVSDVSIFKLSLIEASSERTKAINMGANPQLARIFYNKYQAGLRHFVTNYLSYFSPEFYFFKGPSEATYGMIPGRGVLYWFELPLFLAFVFYIVKNFNNKRLWPVLFWYLVSPIPAALSLGPGYAANRAVIQLPSIQIFLAIGFFHFLSLMSKIRYRYAFGIIYFLFSMLFFFYFLLDYFLLSPVKISKDMLYGRMETALWLINNARGKEIVMSRSLSEPHIYVAFASKLDPKIYQEATSNWNYKELGLKWVDQMPSYKLGDYIFESIDPYKYLGKKDLVLVGKPEEFKKGVNPIKIINYLDGDEAILVVETPLK